MTYKQTSSIPCNDNIIVSIDMADLPLLIDYYSNKKKEPVLPKIDVKIKTDKPKKGRLMSAREVSKYLRIKLQILHYLVERKSIPFEKKGDHLYFNKSEVQQWFTKRENIDLIENIQKSKFFQSL